MNENIGKIFGCYKIIDVLAERNSDGHLIYVGECIFCKEIYNQCLSNFKRLKTKTCTHSCFGLKTILCENLRLAAILRGMARRCYYKDCDDYRYYGLKNIKICKEWTENPKNFEKWALNNEYKENLTIDRIDSKKDYSPENCRWVTLSDNAKYKSTTILITVNKITKTGREWADFLKVGTNLINTYRREKGLEFTINFIKQKLSFNLF